MAGRLHESRLHERKPADVPKSREGNSLCRAIRSVESAMQQDGEREEDRSVILRREILLPRLWDQNDS